MSKDTPESIQRYLQRHALVSPPQASDLPKPLPGLKLCVVIPCLAERENIQEVLDSLERASSRLAEAEVLLIVNNPEEASQSIELDNRNTLLDLQNRMPGPLAIHCIDHSSTGRALPPDQAGVGLARRIGMDLALRRLVEAGAPERASIACLDADSPVGSGYVDLLLDVFDDSEPPLVGVCSYAHPVPEQPDLARAIVAYELWMRYFERGLSLSGSLFSYPTIGSCLVASAVGYALADGMPPKQAGEDFYFFQKLAKVSGKRPIARLPAEVFPAARASERVPFGTGRALLRCLSEGPEIYLTVEPPETFFDLRRFFNALPAGFEESDLLSDAACERLRDFLDSERAWPVLDKIRRNHSTPERFALAVHHWFDALRIVRYAHYCERELGRVWLFDALLQVLTGLERREQVADLEYPRSPDPELALQISWLEKMRAGLDDNR